MRDEEGDCIVTRGALVSEMYDLIPVSFDVYLDLEVIEVFVDAGLFEGQPGHQCLFRYGKVDMET